MKHTQARPTPLAQASLDVSSKVLALPVCFTPRTKLDHLQARKAHILAVSERGITSRPVWECWCRKP